MAELRLVGGQELSGAGPAPPLPTRLRPGRHGLPADLVRAHQRERLLEAAAAALAEQGYGRLTAARITAVSGVSSRTFYQHFEDLWACMARAHEVEADRLCAGIEAACAAADSDARVQAGIAAVVDFLAAEPAVAYLLSAAPPPQVSALVKSRRRLFERLEAMLRQALSSGGAIPLPGLEHRLVGAAVALVRDRAAEGGPEPLRALDAELGELLLRAL